MELSKSAKGTFHRNSDSKNAVKISFIRDFFVILFEKFQIQNRLKFGQAESKVE